MSTQAMTPVLLAEDMELTLTELCRASCANVEQVQLWVLEGVLVPSGDSPVSWRFSAATVRRASIACRLTEDLQLNAPGVALALDLMDKISALEARLARGGR